MNLPDALRLVARRWIVIVIGLAIAAGVGSIVMDRVPPTYQASGEMLFVLPQEATGRATPTNPLLNLQDGLATTASLMGNEVSSNDVRASLGELGYIGDYSVALVPGTGPLLNVTATAEDPAVALGTRNAVIEQVNLHLAQLQADIGVPERQKITTTGSNVESEAVKLSGDRVRALAGVVALAGLLTLLAAFGLDPLLTRVRDDRRARRQRRKDPGQSAEERPAPAAGGHPEALSAPAGPGPLPVGPQGEADAAAGAPAGPAAPSGSSERMLTP